ncbi:MFS transporter [Novosphingobium sp. BK486]|uniref:MFS transporter n=1 Tax=unclassified Novosphingobium TaxID=2644732 RepID=UPI0017B1FA6E|nr:MFS family permease [Novosphingobium sp. BK256]MBB3376309.1 MFS family permease [Novosphingobium sp. BK280]MBB3422281.1 MFS family permease [Novosphingobium sp. BK267]MBB3450981.1 MFS family permease [Novosphingobium sp. BK352]MBB3479489.1 MFS family permease [Novosphingobium sp. BK369]MBB3502896.1 MFS family permease [Novosphingobium sp. BK336]MBB3538682.1 MFS family permease [Novosphingobium sp. BK486]MBB3557984.1 MFS family permease [Novosphingobium sp. BK349]MBB3599605.1 MFS family p
MSLSIQPRVAPATHPLSIPAFRHFWIARICAMLAQSNLVVVLGWAVYDVARLSMDMKAASLRIGLIGLSQFLPVLLINPFAGLVADRHDRRLVVRLALLVQMLAVGVLVALQAMGRADLPVFYLVAAGFAAGRGFYAPAMNALAPALVPVEILPRAIAVSAIAGRIGGIVGPVLGGFAYGVAPAFAYGLTLALLGAALVAQLAIGPHGANRPMANGKPLAHILEGLRYVARSRMLLGAISLDLFAVLLGGATAMLPVYARDILHVGPSGLGLLRSASSVGAVSTALWLSWRPVENGVGPKMLAAVALFGIASAVFGISRWLPLSLAMLALAGAADMISVYVRQTLVQVVTPDAMRGRVGATSALFITASNELGEMESGVVGAILGPVGSVVFGGVSAVAIALAWGRLFPELKRVRRFDELLPES